MHSTRLSHSMHKRREKGGWFGARMWSKGWNEFERMNGVNKKKKSHESPEPLLSLLDCIPNRLAFFLLLLFSLCCQEIPTPCSPGTLFSLFTANDDFQYVMCLFTLHLIWTNDDVVMCCSPLFVNEWKCAHEKKQHAECEFSVKSSHSHTSITDGNDAHDNHHHHRHQMVTTVAAHETKRRNNNKESNR